MNQQEGWWAGDGGDSYLARNRVDWRARSPFWKSILDKTGARSVYEFGCNAGYNLSAIKRACPDVDVWGTDINARAAGQAQAAGLNVWLTDNNATAPYECVAELTFSCGVLIHIPPDNLKRTMQMLIDKSYDYVLAVEYASPVDEMIEYRGQKNLLWKRPYGELYKELGLELVDQDDAGPAFDRCTCWLLRKP